jgi:hypothetical protein
MKLFTLNCFILFGIFQFAIAKLVVDKTTHLKSLKYALHRDPLLSGDPLTIENEEDDVETLWITQPLNHFDSQDHRTFQMRYMKNDQYLVDGGPIFIYVGGEWTITSGTLRAGHVHDMTRELNGTFFYTEHRYYGETHPTEDLSIENIRYLNVDQALADLAHFIVEIKASNPMLTNSGVILVGGSYSASMVTWFMQKYPHLANGAWASSAPLLAKVDFTEYKEIVDFAIQKVGGSKCAKRIENGFKQLEKWVEEGNAPAIEEAMLLCESIDLSNKFDVNMFFSIIAEEWSGIVQYHKEHLQDIQKQCEIMTENDEQNDAINLGNWFFHEYFERGDFDVCFDYKFDTMMKMLKNTSYGGIWRQWMYQSCAEYGWFQTSGNDTMFGTSFPLGIDLEFCREAYTKT